MPTPSTGLSIGPDVLAHIGAQTAHELRTRTRTFTCGECQLPGDATSEPVSLVLASSPGYSTLGFAHHRCSASRVAEFGAGEIPLPRTTEIIPRAIALPNGMDTRAALLVTVEEDVIVLDPDGTPVNPMTEHLLSSGLHRLTSLGRTPPPSPGWTIQCGPADQLTVRSPLETVLREGQMYAPGGWLSLVAAQAGSVTLLIGRLDADDIYAETPPLAAYGAAIKSGRLLGGAVPVTLLRDPLS